MPRWRLARGAPALHGRNHEPAVVITGALGPLLLAGAPCPPRPTSFSRIGLSEGHRPPSAAIHEIRTVPGLLPEVCPPVRGCRSLSFRTRGPLVARPRRAQQVWDPGFPQGGRRRPEPGFQANAKRGLRMRKAFTTSTVRSSPGQQGSRNGLQTRKPRPSRTCARVRVRCTHSCDARLSRGRPGHPAWGPVRAVFV